MQTKEDILPTKKKIGGFHISDVPESRDIMNNWLAWKDELIRVFRLQRVEDIIKELEYKEYYSLFEKGMTPTEAYVEMNIGR